MKSFFLFLALLSSTAAFSQWKWQNPWPQGNNLNAVFATDPQHCWMVGDFGAILFDDGNGLSFQKSGTLNGLNALWFFDNNEGWAGGQNGIMLHYKAGDWIGESDGLSSNINAMHFLSKDLGWAVGDDGHVLKYENAAWSLFAATGNWSVSAVWFDSAQEGWIGGYNSIKHYNGVNWISESLPPLVYGIYWIKRLENGTLWASCNYETDPGDPGDPNYAPRMLKYEGSTWNLVADAPMASTAISFVNDSLFVVAGGYWLDKYTAKIAEFQVNASDVSMVDKNHAWAVGENGGISFFNGETWVDKSKGFYRKKLQDIEMFGPNNGIVVDRSSDYFYRLQDSVWGPDLMYNCLSFGFRDIDFKDPSHGWGVGTYGRLWDYSGQGFDCDYSSFGGSLNAIALIDSISGWVGSTTGDLLKIKLPWVFDGYNIGNSKEINKLYFSTPDDGWAAGWDMDEKVGFVFNYKNGSWSEFHLFPQTALYSFFMNAQDDIWVAGRNTLTNMGSIGHFDGQSWSLWEDYEIGAFRDIHLTSHNNGWAVGDYGKICHFDGQSWKKIPPLTNGVLRKIFFIDDHNGWAVGDNSAILYITNGGGTSGTSAPSQDVRKEKFWLSPNPATDFIALNSSKPPQNNLDLTLFDGQGNIVQCHQNISLETLFDVSQLKSGLYFWIASSQNQNMAAGKFLILAKK